MLQLILLIILCAFVSPLGIYSAPITGNGNEADDESSITWGDLPAGKDTHFPTDRGGVLIGLYAMTNVLIYICHPMSFDYGLYKGPKNGTLPGIWDLRMYRWNWDWVYFDRPSALSLKQKPISDRQSL
ncbi:hypothetical protein LSAT2_024939 [Lamellibrachia satsuma]|nr:hypothetical protein LSAT2_024939 [Lamellibrachia satsuma]